MVHDADAQKLGELVLYVADRCQTHELFGKIKLNKILFYSDVNAYSRRGRSITGVAYVKHQFGPVPSGIDVVIQDLSDDRAAVVRVRDMPDLTEQKRVVPLRKPDLTRFTAEEIAIVNEIIDWMRPMSARQISDLTHETAGWCAARMGETIPYAAAALVPDRPIPLTEEERAHGQELARRLTAA